MPYRHQVWLVVISFKNIIINKTLYACTYGLSWKSFLQATTGISVVMSDVIEVGIVVEGDVCMSGVVGKVGGCVVDHTDTEVVSLERTKIVKIVIIWCL